MRRALIVLFIATTLRAAEPVEQQERHGKLVWIASIAALAVSSGADAATSWHGPELNGALASHNGSFGARGVGIKIGLAAGFVVPQIIFRKNPRARRAFTIGNFAQAGAFGAAAIHNARQ